MTSTMIIRKTPEPTKEEVHLKQPVKGIIARYLFDHDGSLTGPMITIGSEHLEWFEGLHAGFDGEKEDIAAIRKILKLLRGGRTIDIWIEC